MIAGRRSKPAALAALAARSLKVKPAEKKPATWVPVYGQETSDAYVMHSVTHEIRRAAPKAFRTKRERVRARRKAAKVQGW